ncbi:MAG TPA: hypothetical protein VHX13_04130 [Acidobacteriaceae bacterium]|jgi:hypothetical protein|nr:hypothetical protein [Acidobacteriaceae bacterium]
MSRESSLHLVTRAGNSPRKLDSRQWRVIFQILTVIGMILVLISLLLLLQGLGAGDVPQASFFL